MHLITVLATINTVQLFTCRRTGIYGRKALFLKLMIPGKYLSLFLLYTLLTFRLNAQAYQELKLFELAATADLVAYGKIVRLDPGHYRFSCTDDKGRRIEISVRRFAGHPGSYRWAQYETGQEMVVFLKKINGGYVPMNSGAESEIPVIRDSVIVDMRYFTPETVSSLAPGKDVTDAYRKAQTFPAGSKKIFGLRFPRAYFFQSVTDFRKCYQIILKKGQSFASYSCFNFFERYIRDKTDVYKKNSRLFRLLYEDMEKAQVKNCK